MASPLPYRNRTWPTRAIGVLLLLQAAGLAGLFWYSVIAFTSQIENEANGGTVMPDLVDLAVAGAPLAALAALSLASGIGFFFLFAFGWLLALTSQGLILLYCLNQYFFGSRPEFVFPIMIYSVLMVLYLNSSGVRMVFSAERRADEGDGV